MILPIVKYPDPVLRKKGSPIAAIRDDIRDLARDMIETMHAANGVGLAAQQIGKPLQIAVVDVRKSEHPSQMLIGARDVPVESQMPLVLINPSITQHSGEEIDMEGCLSFPELTGDILRSSSIHVTATRLDGTLLKFTATGLLARAVQHELDHLNGVLFIDRMAPSQLDMLKPALEKLEKTAR